MKMREAMSLLIVIPLMFMGCVSLTTNRAAAQTAGTWYPGEGLESGMWVKYEIQYYDTNNARPFEITLFFVSQDNSGNWLVPVSIVDEDQTFEETWTLGTTLGLQSSPTDETRTYHKAYDNSISLLMAYFEQLATSSAQINPKSLALETVWGKYGSTGLSFGPVATEQISLEAGNYDTTVLSMFTAASSVEFRLWMADGFPYPVQGEYYRAGDLIFAFELLDAGTGNPSSTGSPLDESTQQSTAVATLDGNSYEVIATGTARVTSVNINAEKSVTLSVSAPGEVQIKLPKNMIDGITTITAAGQSVPFSIVESTATDTTINLVVPSGADSVEIAGAMVVPEFGMLAAIILATSLLGVIAIVRYNGKLLGYKF